jgi:OOP family OmpA-OmpF porin
LRTQALAGGLLVVVLVAGCGSGGGDVGSGDESAAAPDDRSLPTQDGGDAPLPTGQIDDNGLPTEDPGGSDNPDVTSATVSTEIPPPTTTAPPTTQPPPEPEPPPCRLEGDTLFATNRWDLRATRPLEVLAATIERQADNPRLRIEGHTDSRGSDQDNLLLSQRRADAVRAWFVQDGFPAGRISARGLGERHLRRPDTDASGAFIPSAGALNRRVEIFVFSRHAVDC